MPTTERRFVGERVRVFDPLAWGGKDVGDNSQFYLPATIVGVGTSRDGETIYDVDFDHRGLSRGHFLTTAKPLLAPEGRADG